MRWKGVASPALKEAPPCTFSQDSLRTPSGYCHNSIKPLSDYYYHSLSDAPCSGVRGLRARGAGAPRAAPGAAGGAARGLGGPRGALRALGPSSSLRARNVLNLARKSFPTSSHPRRIPGLINLGQSVVRRRWKGPGHSSPPAQPERPAADTPGTAANAFTADEKHPMHRGPKKTR